MTFKHKLSVRLALLKDAMLLLSAAAILGCEKPVNLAGPAEQAPLVTRVVVSPRQVTLSPSQTSQFTAVALTAAGDTVDVRVTWSATGGTLADTFTNGHIHYATYQPGTVPGNYLVIATDPPETGVADTSTVTVANVPVASVGVTPAVASMLVGRTLQLTATPLDASGTALSGRSVTWSSSAPAVATVGSGGLVTAAAVGSATITATSEGKSSGATITVTSVPVASVTVSPAAATLPVGGTQPLAAATKDATGASLAGRIVTWSSSNPAVATVTGSGLVTGIAAGSATITATSEGQSGTAAITVTAPPPPPPPPPSGTAYYVASNGNDAVSCAQAQNSATPKQTLNNAVGCLTPGATLLIRGGTYTESLFDNIPAGTSWNAPVTLRAYPGETVTLRPNPGAYRVLEFVDGQVYIVIDGLILDGANVTYEAVKITYNASPASGAHHIRLMNSEVKNAPAVGILDAENTGHNEFLNLHVHHNGPATGTWQQVQHGFYLGAPYAFVDHCDVHDQGGYGIQIQYATAVGTIVRNTKTHGNRGGIVVNNGPNNILLYNNLVWDNSWVGIQITSGTSNVQVFNNTVYHNGASTGYHGIQLDGQAVNTTVENNIAYLNVGSDIFGSGGAGTVIDHNLTGIDPGFINAATADFHLAAGSRAIDAGITLGAVATDFDGVTRPRGVAYDLGAFEF